MTGDRVFSRQRSTSNNSEFERIFEKKRRSCAINYGEGGDYRDTGES